MTRQREIIVQKNITCAPLKTLTAHRMRKYVFTYLLIVTLFSVTLSGCNDDSTAPVDDGGDSDIVDDTSYPACGSGAIGGRCRCGDMVVDSGYCCDDVPQDMACSEPDPCDGITCSYHGECVVDNDTVACECDDDYHAMALDCVTDTSPGCLEKNMAYSDDTFTRRHRFAFAFKNGQPPSTEVVSDCLTVSGLSAPIEVSARKGALSVNDGPWLAEDVRVSIQNGDTLRRRLTTLAEPDAELRWAYIVFHEEGGDLYNGEFGVRTENRDREPQTFAVGPGQTYRELSEVADELRAGDIVEVYGGATYESVEFNRAGLPDAPITIRGISVEGERPVISGGEYTVDLDGSHHYRLENLIITGGSQICVRHAANDVLLRDCAIHTCARHGIMGTDLNSGTLVLDRVEVSYAGGEVAGENLKHAVYVATDRDRYPGSKLKVIFSYIHDYGGNGIKSRAARNEIYYNWIEAPDQDGSYYTLELDGFEEYEPEPGIDSDVVGNVLVHHGQYAIRVGGDGTGSLRGRVRLANNTIIVGEAFDKYTPIVRLFGELDAVYLVNNAFMKIGTDHVFRLWRNDLEAEDWVSGEVKFFGHNNWVPEGCEFDDSTLWPPGMTDTLTSDGNPGFLNVSSFDTLDLGLDSNNILAGAGRGANGGETGYEITNPLTQLDFMAPQRRPEQGVLLDARARPTPDEYNIGAF